MISNVDILNFEDRMSSLSNQGDIACDMPMVHSAAALVRLFRKSAKEWGLSPIRQGRFVPLFFGLLKTPPRRLGVGPC